MSKYKIVLENIECDDVKALKVVQKKLNQWKTQGILVKYEIHTTSTNIIFNICMLKKESS